VDFFIEIPFKRVSACYSNPNAGKLQGKTAADGRKTEKKLDSFGNIWYNTW